MFESVFSTFDTNSKSLVVVCAWCHRQKVTAPDLNSYWIKMTPQENKEQITHTICPTCKAKMTKQLHILP